MGTAPRESTKHPDPQSGRSREQCRHWNGRRERRDPRETDECNALRRNDWETPAITESCSRWGTENTNGNENMDENEEINQVEHCRAGLTLKD